MSWRTTLGLVLLAAALVTGWAAWKQGSPPTVEVTGPERSEYVLRDFELTSLNDQGNESFTVRAPHLEQTPGDRSLVLDTPLFLIPDRDHGYWQARSLTAHVTADHDQMQLHGQVRITSPEDAERPTKMESERLDVFPGTRTASTDAEVTVTQPGSTMRGTGLHADLEARRFVFQSKVNSRYVPSRR